MSSGRITLNIRRFRIKDQSPSFNVLVVGPSTSRKNVCVQRFIDAAKPRKDRLVIVTDCGDYYSEETFYANGRKGGFPLAELEDADCRVLEGLDTNHFEYFEAE